MADTADNQITTMHQFNKELYGALTRRDEAKVIQRCQEVPEGPLRMVTVHDDTVLHMAAYSKQRDLVMALLKMVPESDNHKLKEMQNDMGDTILHEVATANRLVPAAREILRRAPESLCLRNGKGETAIFRAARYGKTEMFKFLDEEFDKDVKRTALDHKAFHQRDDQATILHMSVTAEHFDLALFIAEKYGYLVSERDGDKMTALQLLACKPSAFYSASKHGTLVQFIYSCLSTKENYMDKKEQKNKCSCRVPLWESIRMQKRRYETASKLAKFLIERDASWAYTESRANLVDPKSHRYGKAVLSQASNQSAGAGVPEEEIKDRQNQEDVAETPLILATKSGCLEIVEEILKMYPQAVEHVDDEGRNVLHVAIKYRQIHIFDFIEKMEIPMRRLVRKIDNQGNSILHMVGIKTEHETGDLRNPALQLQENLLLFERVKKTCTSDFVNLINVKRQTAEHILNENNAKLHSDAKEWLKRTVENCSIVAVLIATVAFAAAYTVPGGSNDKTGYPILLNRPFFITFTIADVLSITFALTSVVTFLSILTSPFQLRDFKRSLPQALMLGVTLLILSVSMMMLAFAATIILTINHKGEWTKIALYSMAFLPVSIFAASYLPLYASLWKTFKNSVELVWQAFPRCTSHQFRSTKGSECSNKYEDDTNSAISFRLEDCDYSV